MRRALPALALALLACPNPTPPQLPALATFQVDVLGVYVRTNATTRVPLGVVSSCVDQYGGQADVPPEVKGQPGCRYLIPTGEVEFDLRAQAIGRDGEPFTDFSGSVAFRVIPGDLSVDQRSRWALAEFGRVEATVKALHTYGEVRVWVEDSAPRPLYVNGELVTSQLPPEPEPPARRSYAAGTSQPVYFADHTLQSLQNPGDFDNRSSPFVGEFVTVGKDPSSGDTLKQSCANDPLRNNRDALMVVTGLDPSGFFVTDISACRLLEQTRDSTGAVQVRTPERPEPCMKELPDGGAEELLPIDRTVEIELLEDGGFILVDPTDGGVTVDFLPDGGLDVRDFRDAGTGLCQVSRRTCAARANCQSYLPGTYGSMFVYNYNFPDGLDEGDLLFTLAGSVQEFTSTTQMVFPSWTVAERVRRLPQEQWNKWLQFARPYDIGGRTCGWDDVGQPFLTDALCGHNRRNLKMESLESSLVRVRRVRFPRVFKSCDFNANGSVPFFCETRPPGEDWQWATCNFDGPEPEADRLERECTQNCVIGMGEQAGVLCTEAATFRGFGQFVVELAPAGPARLGLDESLPSRLQTVTATVSSTPTDGGVAPPNPTERATGYGVGTEVALTCTRTARFRAGSATVVADDGDPLVPADTVVRYTFKAGESAIGFQAIDEKATCTVGLNTRSRINLITKDAIPELDPDCREDDADDERAAQCRNLRGADFDVIGHLRHVQPARPRWVVIPRAPDDVCCYPGPGLECPRPILPCR